MYYYKHHIGDFRSGTSNMSRQERWLYRDMLDVYYDKESPLPLDLQDVCDSIGATDEESKSVAKILRIKFNLGETGWVHERCETELDTYRANAEKARDNGKKGGRPRKNNPSGSKPVASGMQDGTGLQPDCNPQESGSQANHKPLTINQEPVKSIEADASATSDKKPSEDGLFGDQPESQLKCPVGHIVDSYHAAMPMNPQVKVLNDVRKKTIAARWREASRMTVAPFGYKTVAEGLTAWKAFFEVCNESPFLTGKAKALPGKPPFIADIDFLMSPSGFASTLENKYHREVA